MPPAAPRPPPNFHSRQELGDALTTAVRGLDELGVALERARGETAALRNLANAAALLKDNPALLQLRLVQQLAATTGHTVVIGQARSGPDRPHRPAVVSTGSGTQGVRSMPTVIDHLTSRGVTCEAIPHEKTYTSIEEARALGIAADEVVKTVVLDTASGHVLVAVPSYRRLDMKLVEEAVGDHHARLASEEELTRDFPDYELGSLPPLGSLLGAPLFVDPEVMAHETVVFAAGRQTESVKVRTEDLFRDEAVTIVSLTLQPEVPEDGGLLEGGHRV